MRERELCKVRENYIFTHRLRVREIENYADGEIM